MCHAMLVATDSADSRWQSALRYRERRFARMALGALVCGSAEAVAQFVAINHVIIHTTGRAGAGRVYFVTKCL